MEAKSFELLTGVMLVCFVVLVVIGLMHFQIQHLMSLETTHRLEGLSSVAYLMIVS